jgi:hypothetical protein
MGISGSLLVRFKLHHCPSSRCLPHCCQFDGAFTQHSFPSLDVPLPMSNSLSRSFAECTDRSPATDGLIARGGEEEEDKKEEDSEDEGYSE